jgi:hypothetical protein
MHADESQGPGGLDQGVVARNCPSLGWPGNPLVLADHAAVGCGQIRTGTQPSVLTMITGYAGW